MCLQVASEKGNGFCKVPSQSAVLGVNACDISCKRCKACACFDYCPFCTDAPPVKAPGTTCPQLACPRSPPPIGHSLNTQPAGWVMGGNCACSAI